MTAPFATELLGWKTSRKNKMNWALVPNFAGQRRVLSYDRLLGTFASW